MIMSEKRGSPKIVFFFFWDLYISPYISIQKYCFKDIFINNFRFFKVSPTFNRCDRSCRTSIKKEGFEAIFQRSTHEIDKKSAAGFCQALHQKFIDNFTEDYQRSVKMLICNISRSCIHGGKY